MRNLKKFLALVLAMIMAMSLMVTANAAGNYSDMADVTQQFVEAVDVLSGMKVFQGDEKGFRPGDTITRAEVATIVYRLSTGDATGERMKLYSTYGNFSDVKPDDWFAGAVGYCANAGYIKGKTTTTFAPYAKVTGYEALAMILRAVGYDKNGEFTGATWETNVASLATQLELVKNINATRYAGTLHAAARRDVVAELLFQSALIPTVTYTPAFGYQTGNISSGVDTRTLGYKYYGLADATRVILGNQATGEDGVTKLGNLAGEKRVDYNPNYGGTQDNLVFNWTEYTYPGVQLGTTPAGAKVYAPEGISLNYTTGLDLFGHKVKVWYDARGNGAHNVYDLKDKAVSSAIVGGTADGINLSDTTQVDFVGSSLQKAGFYIWGSYFYSDSFSRIEGNADNTAITEDTSAGEAQERFTAGGYTLTAYPARVWKAINNGSGLDVLINVNCEVAEISEKDDVSATKTIELRESRFGDAAADNSSANGTIAQSTVQPASAMVLGNTVVATQVTRRTNSNWTSVYWLDTPTKTVTGNIISYDPITGAITMEGGTNYKRTIIWNDALMSGLETYNPKNLTDGSNTTMPYGQYTVTLDTQGNWLRAERAYNNNFIYGTYLDYNTQLGTSTFVYKMVGVDMDGKMTTTELTRYITDANNSNLSGVLSSGEMGSVGMPYHNVFNANGLVPRSTDSTTVDYMGFIINGKTVDNRDQSLWDIARIQSLAADSNVNSTGFYDFQVTAPTTITTNDIQMTVKALDTDADGTNANPYLYFTEQTKFIVINKNGYGTDTLQPKVYTGISELLGNAQSVTLSDTDLEEILFTSSNYIYANTGAVAKQVDTIFIPETELSYSNGVSTYFIHNTSSAITDSGSNSAKLYTVYQGGESSTVWIAAGFEGSARDQFWTLTDTGDKAADGRTIYAAAKAATGEPKTNDGINAVGVDTFNGDNIYVGTTNNGLTAMIDLACSADAWTAFNVANVKVVNFVPGYNVNNLNDLNNLASLNSLNGGKKVKVCVEYAAIDAPVATSIYVIAVEN